LFYEIIAYNYNTLFWVFGGQTIGKMLVRTKIVKTDQSLKKFFCFLLLLFVGLTGCMDNKVVGKKPGSLANASLDAVDLKSEDIISAEFFPFHGGAGGQSISLQTDNPQDKAVIQKVVNLMQKAKIDGEVNYSPLVMNGGSPTALIIKLRNNRTIGIVDAVKAVSKKLANGGVEIHGESIKDEVTVSQKGKNPLNILSPKLKNWIEGGWTKDIIQYGKQVNVTVAWNNSIYLVTNEKVSLDKIEKQIGQVKRQVSPKLVENGDIARNTPEGPMILQDIGRLYEVKRIKQQIEIALERVKGQYNACFYWDN
jgi:hypothetical protein